jgi:hypothetical protein
VWASGETGLENIFEDASAHCISGRQEGALHLVQLVKHRNFLRIVVWQTFVQQIPYIISQIIGQLFVQRESISKSAEKG